MTVKIKVLPRTVVKAKAATRIVGQVIAGSNVTVTNAGGNFTVSASLGGTHTGTWAGEPIGATVGGTGQSFYTTGDLLYASSPTALSKLAAGTLGYALMANGAGLAPSYQGFLQSGTSAVTRTWQDKGRDILNAKDFGVVADGVTDNAGALNLAFAEGGATGKTVMLPPGVILFASALTATGVGSTSFDIVGAGNGATKLRSTFATGDVLTYNVTNGSIRHIRFESTVTRTSGATIKLIPNGALVFDCTICAPYLGIHNTGQINRVISCNIGAAADAALSNLGPITSRATAATSGGIYNEGGILQINNTVVSGGTLTPAAMPEFCVRSRGKTDLSNSNLYLANKGFWADPVSPQGAIGSIVGSDIDSVLDIGILIDATNAVELEHCISDNWITCGFGSTAATAAIRLLGEFCCRITISNNNIVAYNDGVGHGIWLDQEPASGTSDVGVVISGNNIGLENFGFSSGVFVSENVGGFNITANSFRDNAAAVTLSSGATDYAIVGNNMEGNTSKLTGHTASSAKKAFGNTGVAGEAFDGTVTAADFTASGILTAGTFIRWGSSTLMSAPADGLLLLQNNAATGFTRLQLGGTTSSFPSLKRNGTALNVRLADDSADANVTVADVTASGIVTAGAASYLRWASSTLMSAPADGRILLQNNAANDFGRLQFGGTTSSFPALRRTTTALNVRLADDSADAPLTALSYNGLTVTTSTGTLTIANGKTLTASNTLTLSGTDGSTLNVGAGGTLGTAAYKNTGTSGNTVALLDGTNTWSAPQNITVNSGAFEINVVTQNGAAGAVNRYIDNTGNTADHGIQSGDGVIRTSSAIRLVIDKTTGKMGYSTAGQGNGGTVTQGTSKSTGVTLNKATGTITMHNAALADNANVSFTVTNSTIAATDTVIINHSSVGTGGGYLVSANTINAGSFGVTVRNVSGGSLSEAIVLTFAIFRGATS